MSTLPRALHAASGLTPEERLVQGQQQFIELWSQMAGNWGVPPSMAEIHALLFIEGRPLNTDDIMARLEISRGNASMTLRTLEEWGIVTRQHSKSDRRDYFAAEQDVRTLFCTVICARKRREIDPLVGRLNACREATELDPDQEPAPDVAQALHDHNQKLDQMLDFVRAFDLLTERFLSSGGGGLADALDALRGAP